MGRKYCIYLTEIISFTAKNGAKDIDYFKMTDGICIVSAA